MEEFIQKAVSSGRFSIRIEQVRMFKDIKCEGTEDYEAGILNAVIKQLELSGYEFYVSEDYVEKSLHNDSKHIITISWEKFKTV